MERGAEQNASHGIGGVVDIQGETGMRRNQGILMARDQRIGRVVEAYCCGASHRTRKKKEEEVDIWQGTFIEEIPV